MPTLENCPKEFYYTQIFVSSNFVISKILLSFYITCGQDVRPNYSRIILISASIIIIVAKVSTFLLLCILHTIKVIGMKRAVPEKESEGMYVCVLSTGNERKVGNTYLK